MILYWIKVLHKLLIIVAMIMTLYSENPDWKNNRGKTRKKNQRRT